MSRRVVVTHLASLVGWLAGAAAFFNLRIGPPRRQSVYDTVHLGSVSSMGILVYFLLFEVVRAFTPVRSASQPDLPSWATVTTTD